MSIYSEEYVAECYARLNELQELINHYGSCSEEGQYLKKAQQIIFQHFGEHVFNSMADYTAPQLWATKAPKPD